MINEATKKRFLSQLRPDGECLLYTGSTNKKGYGQFSNIYGITVAHRFAWQMSNGPIPQGLMVLHKCDNPPCVRIDHLWLGTAQENTNDMLKKGRRQDYSKILKGENNPASKITEQQAHHIAQLITSGMSARNIANELKVSEHIVYGIRQKRTWKHLEFTIPVRTTYMKTCQKCNIEFLVMPFELETTKYCSSECYWETLKKDFYPQICLGCQKEFTWRQKRPKKYCSLSCLWETMKGKYPENIKNK